MNRWRWFGKVSEHGADIGLTRGIPCADSAENLYWSVEAVGNARGKHRWNSDPPVFRTALNSLRRALLEVRVRYIFFSRPAELHHF